MTPWFADTFFFIALLSRTDTAHEAAVEFSKRLSPGLLTTHWVLTEVADAMAEPSRRSRFVELLGFLRSNPRVSIIDTDRELFDRGVERYAARLDKPWSLTDCISFVVMEQYGVREALTGDHHFEQAGFVALLK